MSGTKNTSSPQRNRNNLAIGVVLFSFVALVFAITVVKMMNGNSLEAFDHSVRPSLEVVE